MEGTSELIAHGTATILSIGTVNPPNVILQKEYPDFYFKATGSEDLKDLKRKFQRICDRTDIRKRHLYLNEEILEASPNIASFDKPSIEDRLRIAAEELPRLAKEASLKAIKEWGRPVKDITHLVFNTTLAATMPGADYTLVKMLGLNANVKRTMLYMQGCFAGGTILRHAKDIVENNRGARVLAVTSETNAVMFRKPHPDHIDSIIGQALFGDGAAAVVVGCGPLETEERAVFEVCETEQVILPDLGPGDKAPIEGRLDMAGISLNLVKELPDIVSGNLEELMEGMIGDTLGIHDWNELFWVVHPGGRGILDAIEVRMGLAPECLNASRHVLREYGNMSSVCVLFVLDETRNRSLQEGFATTGEGKEWGILLGFGPGVTVEAVLLRSVPTIA